MIGWLRRALAAPPAPLEPTPSRGLWEMPGTCPVCERRVAFVAYGEWLRDAFVCDHCGSVPRDRAVIAVLQAIAPDWRSKRIHESSPGTHAGDKLAAECPGYVASQLDPALPSGTLSADGRYRSEDLERQTFPDAGFDIVVTQDVFEHIFDPAAAIREIRRTLAPGGLHLCTAPLGRGPLPSVRRAARDVAGVVTHLAEPVFHQNPMSQAGSLVTIDWGYDIADFFDAQAEVSSTIHALEDRERGILGPLNEVVVSRAIDRAAPSWAGL